MKEYTNISTTPLKFHKFYWKIWMPVQIVLGGWNFGIITADLSAADLLTRIDAAHFIISGVLFAAAMGGFFRWKRSALICVFVQMAENIIYVVAMYMLTPPTAAGPDFALSAVIGTLIRCIPVSIYYYNRRKLFVKGGYTKEQMEAINNGQSNSFAGSFGRNAQNNPYSAYNAYSTTNSTDTSGATVCPHCKKTLPNNPNFCIYCGGRVK